jgi:hypothetical protein
MPDRTGEHITATDHSLEGPREVDLVRAAFRDLHGARLHGFALLVSLGDRPRAARAAADSLAQGVRRADELRHPERAAAWLRARVLRTLRRAPASGTGPPERERQGALRGLGGTDAAFLGLAALPIEARAALVAAAIERFDSIDVETITGLAPAPSQRAVERARERYVSAVGASVAPQELEALPVGELRARVDDIAGRAMGVPGGDR